MFNPGLERKTSASLEARIAEGRGTSLSSRRPPHSVGGLARNDHRFLSVSEAKHLWLHSFLRERRGDLIGAEQMIALNMFGKILKSQSAPRWRA